MASYLGVELGPDYIRAVELEGSVKKPIVRRFRHMDLTSAVDEDGMDTSLLSEFWKSGKFKKEPAVASLNSLACTFRDLDLPFTGEDQIRKVIKYEAENHIPQEDVDDLVVAFRKLGQHRDKSHLMIVAARKDRILEYLGSMQATGVDPYHLDIDLTSLFNAATALGLPERHERFAVANLEGKFTSILIVENDEILMARTMRIGFGDSLPRIGGGKTEALEKAAGHDEELLVLDDGEVAGADLEEADLSLPPSESPAASESLPPSGLSEAYLRRLDREVRRLLTATPLSESVEKVYLTGRGGQVGELQTRFQEMFGAPAEAWDLLETTNSKLSGDVEEAANQQSAVAMGAAFRLMNHDRSRVDLRQEECSYSKRFDQIKVPLTSFLVMLFVLVALFDIYFFRRLGTLKTEMADVEESVEYEYEAYGPPDVPLGDRDGLRRIRLANARLAERQDDLMSQLGRSGKVAGLPSALAAFALVMNALTESKDGIGPILLEIIDVDVEDRRGDKRTVTLNGVVENNSRLTTLIEALSKNPDVMEVPIEPRSQGTSDGRLKFTSLEVIIKPEEITE